MARRGKICSIFDKDPNMLIDVVRYSMETCPKWVRLPRVIRDIPCSVYVEGGNNIGNMRQMVDNLRLRRTPKPTKGPNVSTLHCLAKVRGN